jgi:VWFA-related protein
MTLFGGWAGGRHSAGRALGMAILAGLAAGAAAAGETTPPPAGGEPARRVETFRPEVVRVVGEGQQRVRLSVSVLDGQGEPVTELSAEDFRVSEDGVARPVVEFGRESDRQDRPLSVVVLVDRSGSIGHQLARWRDACASLLLVLRPIDEVRVSSFTTEVTVVQDFTRDVNLLGASVARMENTSGGTHIFSSVQETIRDLRDRPGRKVIFLLTDGLDNEFPDLWSATSNPRVYELVREAVRSQVTIVTILPGPTARPFLAVQDLAVQTGGWWLYPSDDLPGLMARLGKRLLESYYLAFDSPKPRGEKGRRPVEVKLTKPMPEGVVVRTAEAVYGETPLAEILRTLASDLADDDEARRLQAVAGLAAVPDPKAVTLLVKALKDESPKVRDAAVDSLRRLAESGPKDEALQARIAAALRWAESRK